LNSNHSKSMTHHNQTKILTTWFLNLHLDEYIDNKKHKVWILNHTTHDAQLEDQKTKKSSKRSFRKRKSRKTNKWQEKRQNQRKSKEKLKIILPLKQTPHNHLNASSPP
jgi:hypothetical protein